MVDILAWLTAQGLEKFAPVFTKHEIDFDTLRLLTEDDVGGWACRWGRAANCWRRWQSCAAKACLYRMTRPSDAS